MSGHGFPPHPTYGCPAAHHHSVFLHAPVPSPGMPQHPLANMERMANNIGGQATPPQQLYPDAVLNPTRHHSFVPNIPMPNRAPNSFGYPGAPMLPNTLYLPHGLGTSAQGPSPENNPNLHQQLLESIEKLEAQIEKKKEKTMKLNTKWLEQQQRQMRDKEYWNHQIRLKQSEAQGWQRVAAKYAKIDKATDCEGLPEYDPAPASQERASEPDDPTPEDELDGPAPVTELDDPTSAAPHKNPKVPFDMDEFKAKMMKSVLKVIKTEVVDDRSYGVDSSKGAEDQEHLNNVPSASESSRSSEMPVPPAESVSPTEPERSEISKSTEPEGSIQPDPELYRSLEEQPKYDFEADIAHSSAPIQTSPSSLDNRNVSPDAADSDDSLPPRLLSPDSEVPLSLPAAQSLPSRPKRRRPAYRLLRDAAKVWKPHAQNLPRNMKAFKEYFAIRQIYKKTMKIAPILEPGSLEYAKRVQEANAHRRETLVSGDPACAFVSCLYDASKGPIPQLVTKPPQVWILYASFRRDTADEGRVPTKKEIAADWNRISEQQGDDFWEWKLRTTKLYDEHLIQMEKGYIWVQPDVQPRGRKRKVLDGDERRNSKKARIQPESLEEGSEDSNDDEDDFMT